MSVKAVYGMRGRTAPLLVWLDVGAPCNPVPNVAVQDLATRGFMVPPLLGIEPLTSAV